MEKDLEKKEFISGADRCSSKIILLLKAHQLFLEPLMG